MPRLLECGYAVRVLDLYIYGDAVLQPVARHPSLEQIKGDIRDVRLLQQVMPGCDAVVHLACISNDPSFELNPALGKSINYDAFFDLVAVARDSGVRRFVYASSSSVYGVKAEDLLHPSLKIPGLPYLVLDFGVPPAIGELPAAQQLAALARAAEKPDARAKLLYGSALWNLERPVSAERQLEAAASRINVFGGQQKRPNIHIEDMAAVYLRLLEAPAPAVAGKIFNAGYQNHTVMELAEKIRAVVGGSTEIVATASDDNRSYHISSEKIRRELGFAPAHTIEDAVRGLVDGFRAGLIPNPMADIRYYNIKTMQALQLT